MPFTAIKPGEFVTFSKTVSESDVYLFAGITGDFAPQHVNEQYMAQGPYGRRIAHGVLSLGFASTASSMMSQRLEGVAVSYGYDRLRFVHPVYIGDTVTVHYEITEVDDDSRTTRAAVEIRNQDGEVCLAATHILKGVERSEPALT